jgi:exopolysaccharide biosynthesis polyprenyl glycosylphosphotransferase
MSSTPHQMTAHGRDQFNPSSEKLKILAWVDVITLLVDMSIRWSALALAHWIRFYSGWITWGTESHLPPSFKHYSMISAIGLLFSLISLVWHKAYDRRTFFRARVACGRVIKASIVACFYFLAFSLMLKIDPPISRQFVIVSAVLTISGLCLWRTLWILILKRSGISQKLRQNILFVGWTAESSRLAEAIASDRSLPYEIMGCVSGPTGRLQKSTSSEAKLLGDYSELPGLLSKGEVDVLVLTDLDVVRGEVLGLAELCEQHFVEFKIIPSYFQIFVSALHLQTLSGVPVLGIHRLPLDKTWNRILKRMVDIVGALVGLALSVPICLICGILIYRESPGPIFYRQIRMSRRGKLFEIIKLRSMHLDAEEKGPQWSRKGDDRRLKIGCFLRRWNLDELPQFWIVLKGEMSLVGPRPERPEFIEKFKSEIPNYHTRHLSKPGMTGWAQINGLRGESDLAARIQADLYYLEHWTIWMDFQIMLMTFWRRENAG